MASLKNNNPRKAVLYFTKAIEIWPHNSSAYFLRGITHIEMRQYTEAIRDFNTAEQLNPGGDPSVLQRRGYAYDMLGKKDLAIADYTAAITIDPGNYYAYADRGTIYLNKGYYRQAVQDFLKAIEFYRNFTSVHRNLGCAYFYLGDYDAAKKEFNIAIDLNPHYHKTYCDRGVLYRTLGLLNLARQDYKRALQECPHYKYAQICLEDLEREIAQGAETKQEPHGNSVPVTIQ